MEGTFRPESWIASAVVALASFQLYSALWLYGKLNRRRATPPWLTKVHHLSGVLALVASTAVAYHCLVATAFAMMAPGRPASGCRDSRRTPPAEQGSR